ncbi:TetR family transcriptional regulator [Naumannella halotolerans]|nr:TetR family transcriptional regulator [Naumannella halotolerans]
MTEPKLRGRRPGEPDTRAGVLQAALELFAERGYDRSSVREVARRSGVDPSLVLHYFGSKDGLFGAVMGLALTGRGELGLDSCPVDGLGERLVEIYLGVWESPRSAPVALAMLRSAATNEQAAAVLREIVTQRLFDPVVDRLDGDRVRLRVQLAGSQLIGLAMARYVVRISPLADQGIDELVSLVGPSVQRYLTGDLSGSEVVR